MKMIEKSTKRMMYPLFFIILSGIILFNIIRIASNAGNDKVTAFKVPGGWGYRIVHDDKVYFEQSFIPIIQGKHAFPDKKSALKTGKIFLKRYQHHEVPPLTLDDLKKLGLDSVINE